MAENLFDQPVDGLNTNQTFENELPMETEVVDQQQDPSVGNLYLPSNYLTQSSLYNDGKGKPLDSNPKARAAAANHLIQDKLPQPSNFQELVRRNRAILDSDPLLQAGAYDQPAYRTDVVRRYDDEDYGYIPGIDNDDFYGKREAWYETLGNGLFRLPVYTVTKALQGAGFVGGLVSPWNWGSEEGVVYKAADNTLYKWMESFDDFTKNEWMPNFQQAADREKGFWARAATDPTFWAEDVVDGAAFMVSAFIPGMALSKLGLGAAAMRGLGGLSRVGASSLGATIEGAEAIANYFTQAQKAARGIDQFSTWALATASESMFEAKEVRDNVRNSLRQKSKADGTFYSDEEINKIAGEAARNTFLMNATLLGATNIFQMKYFAKAFGMADNSPMKAAILGGGGLGSQAALSPIESSLKYYGKILGGGIAREGFIEENVQLAIQRVNERYGTEGKVSSLLDFNTYSDLLTQYSAQTIGAVGGVDQEAGLNIGLGALLGGGSNVLITKLTGERKNQRLSAEQALAGYNIAQENWLKFGNIYQTEEVKTKDANGTDIITNRIVLDSKNQPVIDQSKLHAAVTGLQVSSDMLTDAQNSKNKYVKDYLRLGAFSEFVQAHINAGIESTLFSKLDALKTAKPEDLAKLGFVADENFASEIEKHKSLANTIINQNKILNSSILFDNTAEDRSRKATLTSLAAKQALAKFEILDVDRETNEVKNEFLTSDITSLSDGIVDQLNQLLYRIESNKEVIDYLRETGKDKTTPMSVYEKLAEELEKNLKDLIKNNETTVGTLEKNEKGFYNYEKAERNDFIVREFLDPYLKVKGELLNEVKTGGLTWALFADNKDGKNNFMTYFKAGVESINEEKKKRAEEEQKLKEQEAEELKKQDEEEEIVDETPEGEIQQEEEEEETISIRNLEEEEEEVPLPVQEDAPPLQSYLKEKYDSLVENDPEFKLTIDEWIRSGGANWAIKQYNKQYGTNETLFDNKKPIQEEKGLSDQDKQKLVDGLSFVDVSKATFTKALSTIQNVLDQLKGDESFIQKLITKVSEAKDEFYRKLLISNITGRPVEEFQSEYVIQKDLVDNLRPSTNHVGVDMININDKTFETGFILKADANLVQSLASNLSSINERVKVIATRKFAEVNRRDLEKANIPNRTLKTYETDSEIANKLQRGISVIAVSSKSEGFGTQIFTKDSGNTQNAYIVGIENYAIVHPDNSTVPVTFSEEQRDFVKSKMLVKNQPMTDEQFDRLQALYNKVQEYNAEVELLLGENEEMDITPIFNKYFTLSKQPGRFAQKGQSFESLVEANPDSLFDIMYQTEEGEVLEKKAVLIAEKNKGGWVIQFPLNPGETLVYMDEAGDVFPVTKISQYLNDVHGINPQFDDRYPGIYTWIAKQPNDSKGYQPYLLKKGPTTAPIKDFKTFANSFRELKEAILEGQNKQAETKEFVYKGQTFSTLDNLIKYFNINVYGFYRASDWYPNLKYNSATKKFAIELRPIDAQESRSLTKDQKKALDLYFNDGPILFVTDSTKDEDVINSYNSFVKNILTSFESLIEKLSKSDDPTLRKYATSLTSRSLVYYETTKNSTTENINYILKLEDKKDRLPLKYLSFDAGSNVGGLSLAFNEEPVQVKKRNPVKAKKQGLVSLGTLNDSDVPGGQIDKKTDVKEDRYYNSPANRMMKVVVDGQNTPITDEQAQDIELVIEKAKELGWDRDRLFRQLSKMGYTYAFGTSPEAYRNYLEDRLSGKTNIKVSGEYNFFKQLDAELAALEGTAPTQDPTLIKRNLVELENKITDFPFEIQSLFDSPTVEKYKNIVGNLEFELSADLPSKEYRLKLESQLRDIKKSFTLLKETRPEQAAPKKDRRIIKRIDDDAPFMLRSEEEYSKYTEKSYDQEVQWLNRVLKNSGIALRDLGTIIDNLSTKKQVLGYYKDRALYVNSVLSAEGSIYHEAFHGLFRDILTSDQRSFYLSKARGKMGFVTKEKIEEFRSDRNYNNKTDREIVDLMAEELLAEGFRKFKLQQKEPADSWFKKFVRLIERIINFFDKNQKAIDDLYTDFDGGVYSEHVANPENSISKEGVFALGYGRPKLVETVDEETGEEGFGVIGKIPLNMEVQNELVAKLTYRVANVKEGSFAVKFTQAVEQLKSEYDIEALVQKGDPALADAIRNKYQNKFDEASFVLGVPVKYVLDESIANAEDANAKIIEPGENKETLELIEKLVLEKIEVLGLDPGFSFDDLRIPQDEESQEEANKGGDFDKIHINPLNGLTRELRNLFSIIPYKYVDPTLGVTLDRTADGHMLFNAMMKVASDKPIDQIIPSLDKAVKMMEEDGGVYYPQLKAFADFIQTQFGIPDLSDPTSKPTRNLFLYKQFVDTFFITELPSYVIVNTLGAVSKSEIFDASINEDIANKKESIKDYFDQSYRKLKTVEQREEFNKKFIELQTYLKGDQGLLGNLNNPTFINNRKQLNKLVNELKELMDNVNIVLPKNLIRQSFLAIYNIENNNSFNANSKQNIADMEADQRLMKEGAYLQKDFFVALSTLSDKNFSNIFADTKDTTGKKYGNDLTKIDQINSILKKASKYIIKYDINSAIPVYLNAEFKNIYRYTRYTPPVLLAQIVREKGIDVLKDMYPEIREWFEENPLFDPNSLKNQLFLENLELASFGGVRQEVGDNNRNGVTFGNIDSKALHLSNLVHFMNREKITSKRKNQAGVAENVEIITFKRSRTQEEGTTTNFLLTGMYNPYTKDGKVGSRYVLDSLKLLEQEYNRIQREFKKFNDPTAVYRKHTGYNDSLNGRAFTFHNFKHFFQEQQTDPTSEELRLEMREALLNAAKAGTTFKQALASDALSELEPQIIQYANETFKTLKNDLIRYGLVSENNEKITSSLLPTTIRQEFKDKPFEDFGYSNLEDLLLDFHLNIEMNKRMVNQIFDGDIATGIKDSKTFFKRNKSGVISGNSMKTGHFRTAVVDELVSYFYTTINPITGQEDIDLTRYSVNENLPGTRAEKVADGQSYHTMNHRIRMMDSWGRVDTTVKAILQKAKYKKLDKDDIDELESRKIVLNTLKTATGGIFEYYKLSEHLLLRPDISMLVIPNGMTQEEVESDLDSLYSRIETLEDLIIDDPNAGIVESNTESTIQVEIESLYNKVHEYWEPRRGREKLHHMLNSMELDGIDQIFDPNASKKTTLVPVTLQAEGRTDLKPSKSFTSGMFKFLQVETSGVHDRITLQSQARQLLTTYINKLDKDIVYRNKSLKDLAREYSDTLGDIAKSSSTMLDKAYLDKDGNFDLTQLFNTMYNGLKKQGADSNTLKYFEVRENKKTGKVEPVHNPNLPAIKRIITYYYFSLFNDSVFSQKVSGRSDVLVSEYGYQVLYDTQDNDRIITQLEQERNPQLYRDLDRFKTRNLGVSVERVNGKNIYTIEVMIPDFLTNNASERELFLTKLTNFFATRIPTEDKRSMVVAKVVDYLDASHRNSIVVPQLVHILAGSDLDVDKLYGNTFDYYIDYNEEAHVYGDYSKYGTVSQGQFAEYIQYMGNHPSFKALVDAELEKVTTKPVFTADFLKIASQLGISTAEMTVDEIKQKRADILENLDILQKSKNDLQNLHDVAFNAYVSASKKDRGARREDWSEKQIQYLLAKDSLNAMRQELEATKVELSKMKKTLKLVALVNVLKSKKMPVTQADLTKYLKSNPTPVVPVLDNLSLQQKMDILSNEKVFQDYYINERSSVKPFSDIADSIGASVDSVITQNSIYSVMGDTVANQLNSSSKDGIGIAASFNKFLAFSEKNAISLNMPLISEIDSEGNKKRINDFLNRDAIRNTGQALGMFADAAKDPIPSVLNLNPDSAGVSNVIMGMTGNLQFALLINKIPFVKSIIDDYRDSKSIIQGGDSKQIYSLRSLFLSYEGQIIEQFKTQNRLSELFERNKKGEIVMGTYRTVYFRTSPPNKAAFEESANVSLSDLGFKLFYEDNSEVLEDASKAFISNLYFNTLKLNTEIQKLGGILNLIKQQDPDFGKLDSIIENYDYFESGTSMFGDSIAKALTSSKEYTSLVQAARKMSEYSRSILIERDPLFASINTILNIGLNNTYGNDRAEQDISDQITKFIIINKIKDSINEEIKDLKTKKDNKSLAKLAMLEQSAKYFTADYWLENNTFIDDLDYLYATNSGNPFVEFIKVNNRNGIDFLEASSRMKLDKDIAENIINGYEALQKSKDPRTLSLSRQMFYYLLAKDGLGYGSFTFIKYINPDIPQMAGVSESLSEFQKLLLDQKSFILSKRQDIQDIQKSGKKEEEKKEMIDAIVKEIYNNYTKLFDKFFNNKARAGQIDWINGITNKIFSFAGNQKYVKKLYIDTEKAAAKQTVTEVINNGVFSHIDKIKQFDGKYFDFITPAPQRFTIDFTPYTKQVNPDLETVFYKFSPTYKQDRTLESVSFNVLLSNGSGKLYKLNKVNDMPISEGIARTSVLSGIIANVGLTAEYVELNVEGTNKLLNFGFTKKDGIKIFDSTRPSTDIDAAAKRMMYDPSVLSEYSDNKTREEAPSSYENTSEPIDLSLGQSYTDEEVDAMIAAGKFTRRGEPTTAQEEEEDNSIGFRVIGEPTKVKKIAMTSLNIEKIKVGKKTTTTRSQREFENIGIPIGQSTTVNFGGQNFTVTNRGLLTVEEAGGKEVMIKSEGYASINDLLYQQTKDWINGKGKLYVYNIAPEAPAATEKKTITVPYTPKGKQMQVYTVIGSQIFNKDNQEVFKEDSVDRNKIFANVAVKTGRAVVVPHKGTSYIVNKKNQVISAKSGKIMQWDENNGDLRAILAEATKKFTPVAGDITIKEIDDVYNKKSVKTVTLDEFRTQAEEFVKKLFATGMFSKSDILEQLNCL